MPKSLTPKQVIKLLEQNGFHFVRSKGSHFIYRNSDGKRAIVPYHNKDIPKGTLKSILKQAGLSPEDI
ncbi:hypothetical protein A3B18_03785 [Candidatus Giovannonibacteria bacterium RIFCSPLOWO2_01_FULL_46_13]|uniref:Toxin HicA n=1 Tax=Candidatus Giovannonibacteria bacterium RIFCSPLOWO2_01_FULL_46_13 TaxID=1798352 RepID=A0A1F5X3D8_9BACT|nr:MAG: hypothetical protein A3B18_03785 [Candidatus Giovannonibacteria bacterium RIFCSPLOWO2_01_FULL_46_13]